MRIKLFWYVLFFMFSTVTVLSAIKKAEQSSITQQSKTSSIYNEKGGLEITAILELKEGDKVLFKLSEQRSVEGVVTKSIYKPEESLTIVGEVSKEDKSGFMFFATSQNAIGGAVYLPKESLIYKLRFDEKKEIFYLQEQKIEVQKK